MQSDSSTHLPKEDLLVSHNEDDSEVEGEIDEAEEDIEHLLNKFEEPKSAADSESINSTLRLMLTLTLPQTQPRIVDF